MTLPRYPAYRDSGIEWLGEVPAHWRLVRVKRLFHFVKIQEKADLPILSVYRDYGVIEKASRDDNINKTPEDLSLYQTVAPRDLVINKMKSWQGSLGISQHSGITSPDYAVYAPVHHDSDTFLNYALRSKTMAPVYKAISNGIRPDQWRLEPTKFEDLIFPLPDVPEQRTFAAFLDRETAKIDGLVREQERLIELLAEKRRAVVSHAVTKGLDRHAPMKDSGIDWLGEVPAHWEVSRLKHLGYFKAGAGFPDDEQGVPDEAIPFHKVNALARAEADGSLLPSENTISEETASRLRAFIFPQGAVVFAKIGAALLLGRIRFLRERACLDNNLMGFVVDLPNSYQYARYVMSLVRFDLISNPGTVPSLNEPQIANFAVALAPPSEQRAIVAHLDRETAKLDALKTEAERAVSLLKERRAALISAAVTGKIDVRGRVEEAA